MYSTGIKKMKNKHGKNLKGRKILKNDQANFSTNEKF